MLCPGGSILRVPSSNSNCGPCSKVVSNGFHAGELCSQRVSHSGEVLDPLISVEQFSLENECRGGKSLRSLKVWLASRVAPKVGPAPLKRFGIGNEDGVKGAA
eukprot:5744234-Heterocapsa_arctica.AAC.1